LRRFSDAFAPKRRRPVRVQAFDQAVRQTMVAGIVIDNEHHDLHRDYESVLYAIIGSLSLRLDGSNCVYPVFLLRITIDNCV